MEKVLRLGVKLELIPAGKKLDDPDLIDKKYSSSIHEIVDEDSIVITNPTLQSRLIPLHHNERYDCYIFTNGKSYVCRMQVEKSVLDGRIRVVHMKMLSDIEKYERRKYFRLEVGMDLRYLMITLENSAEFKTAIKSNTLLQMPGFKKATTKDISGGGVKFIASEELPVGALIITNLAAPIGDTVKQYVFLGKILSSEPKTGLRGYFIHRMVFVDLNQDSREEFVKYIFEKERETLKRSGVIK